MFKFIASCLILSGLPTTVTADFFGGPDNYDECITEAMKGVTSDVAARAIIISCRNQFPSDDRNEPASARRLSSDELRLLTGKANLVGDLFVGTFHNGNESITVTKIIISVYAKSKPEEKRRYQTSVEILPLSSGQANYTIVYSGDRSDLTWSIHSAEALTE